MLHLTWFERRIGEWIRPKLLHRYSVIAHNERLLEYLEAPQDAYWLALRSDLFLARMTIAPFIAIELASITVYRLSGHKWTVAVYLLSGCAITVLLLNLSLALLGVVRLIQARRMLHQ